MLTFEIESKDSIEVFFDTVGIDELIDYLNTIKKSRDHYHLIIGNELDTEPVDQNNTLVKHVKLVFFEQ